MDQDRAQHENISVLVIHGENKMSFDVIPTPTLPAPGQFSHVVKKGKFIFISGQTAEPEADAGNLKPIDQANRIFGYLRDAMHAAGGTLSDIVKLNIYLTDGSQFPTILDLRPKYFQKPFPATTTIVCHSTVRRELVMEIEAIAILD
jgi:enamine deaminase RidA (YjgF/YER057c/UK114 family)